MSKLHGVALALALSLAACVTDDDVGTPPQTTDGSDDSAEPGDDRVPINPGDEITPPTGCAHFEGKGDGPCTP